MHAMNNTIRFENITKIISGNKLFDNINFNFYNKIYHLTGDNGLGKTTLLKLIMGLEYPTEGKIFINENRISPKTICNIYYVPDDLQIYDFLTGIEFLSWISKVRLHAEDNIKQLIHEFNVSDFLNKTFAEMSLGTKKKFILITALIGRPKFILFDEPFNGLDSQAQKYLKYCILESSKRSGIIFTHHAQEMSNFSSNIEKIKISDQSLIFEK